MADVTNPLTIQLYESYLPTAFDESLTLLQKVNKMIKAINDLENGTFSGFLLPIASDSVLGGIKVGGGLNIDPATGLLSVLSNFPFINALDYNADNKGTRGTAADLQNAINMIKTLGGGTLYIPSGTYLIDSKMILCDNLKIQMEADTILKRAWGGGFFENSDWDNFVSGSALMGASNITIEGGILDGNYLGLSQYPATTCDMVGIAYAHNITIRDTTFKDVLSYHALDLNGVKDVLIENCQFIGYANIINTSVYRESIQIAEAGVFLDTPNEGLDNYTPCQNVTVRKCYFGPSVNCGSPTVAIGNHYTRYNVYQKNIVIEDNKFDGMTMFGIRPYKWVDVKVVNNTFSKCPTAIQISNAGGGIESSKDVNGNQTNLPQCGWDYFISGNTIEDFTSYGIYSSGQLYNGTLARSRNMRVVDNYFSSTLGDPVNANAISLTFWNNVQVKQNGFNDVKRGAVLMGCQFVDYDFNKHDNMGTEALCTLDSAVTDSTQSGYYCDSLNIRSNEINGAQKNAFYLYKVRTFKVIDNDIINPAQLSDGTVRGGIYCEISQIGKILNNVVTGTVGYNLNVHSDCANITTFNNSGSGQVQLFGTNVQNGFYGIDVSGNIIFKPQVG